MIGLLPPQEGRGWGARVLDHGHVELVAWTNWPNLDLSVANAARVSFNAQSSEFGTAERGLVNFLMREHHGTPFEHVSFTWRVKAPIFVFREWHRHRTASISEWSARYSQLRAEFYVPAVEDMRSQVGKPGAYTFEPMPIDAAEGWRVAMARQNRKAFKLYEAMLDQGVAKEVARTVLPVSTYSEMWWTCNLRNLLGFLELRNSDFAQREIRQYADVMERILAKVMPETYEAFQTHGRRKP